MNPACSILQPELRMKACLDGRFLAHLSPDTVTGDDGRQQPDTSNNTAEAVGEVEPVPLVLRSDTVIYDAATQGPVDELLVTFNQRLSVTVRRCQWISSSLEVTSPLAVGPV